MHSSLTKLELKLTITICTTHAKDCSLVTDTTLTNKIPKITMSNLATIYVNWYSQFNTIR